MHAGGQGRSLEVYFPQGKWYDWYTHQVVSPNGGETKTIDTPIDMIPVCYTINNEDAILLAIFIHRSIFVVARLSRCRNLATPLQRVGRMTTLYWWCWMPLERPLGTSSLMMDSPLILQGETINHIISYSC